MHVIRLGFVIAIDQLWLWCGNQIFKVAGCMIPALRVKKSKPQKRMIRKRYLLFQTFAICYGSQPNSNLWYEYPPFYFRLFLFYPDFHQACGEWCGKTIKRFKRRVFPRICTIIKEFLTPLSLIDFSLHVRNRLEKTKKVTKRTL